MGDSDQLFRPALADQQAVKWISRSMDPDLAARQKSLLEAEGMQIDAKGFIADADDHFHVVGIRREIRSFKRSGRLKGLSLRKDGLYPGATYHVMAPGDGGDDLFETDDDRKSVLFRLGEVGASDGWRVHAWVLSDDEPTALPI